MNDKKDAASDASLSPERLGDTCTVAMLQEALVRAMRREARRATKAPFADLAVLGAVRLSWGDDGGYIEVRPSAHNANAINIRVNNGRTIIYPDVCNAFDIAARPWEPV